MSQKKQTGTTKKTTRKSTAKSSSSRKKTSRTTAPLKDSLKKEILLWAVVLVLLIVTLGIFLRSAMGTSGVLLNTFFVGLFGFLAYLIPIYSLIIAFLGLFGKLNRSLWGKLGIGYGIMILLSALLHVLNGSNLTNATMMYKEASFRTGGLVGGLIGGGLSSVIGKTGTILVLVFVLLILIIMLTERSAVEGMRLAGRKTKEESAKLKQKQEERRAKAQLREEERRAYLEKEVQKEEKQRQKEEASSRKVSTVSARTKKEATILDLGHPDEKGNRQVVIHGVDSEEDFFLQEGDELNSESVQKFRSAIQKVSEEPKSGSSFSQRATASYSGPEKYTDGAVDIPLIANDKYLERKRLYEQSVREKLKEGTLPESTDPVIHTGTEISAAEEPSKEVLRPVSTPDSLRDKGTKPAINTASNVNVTKTEPHREEPDDSWDYLMDEADEFQEESMNQALNPYDDKAPTASPESYDDATISTDKVFSQEEFPTGYEDRNETSERISQEPAKPKPVKKPGPTGKYVFPPIDLLREGKKDVGGTTREELLKSAKSLEEVLMTFGVEAKVIQVNRGPAVTRYELQPKQGVKVSRIVNLTNDIAMNLAASSIRIEAPIPGKSAVGIEIPNKESSTVTLREVLESDKFKKAPSKVTFGLGKDIDGEVQVADIARMPHMLIAGATGSGKSVCINSMIISILYKADPNDVKLILIDPKVVELSIYNGIPHLLLPVVNDPKQASATLNWAVQEMTRRFKKFAEMNVRDIKGYNQLVEELKDDTKPKMPQIVIIIDELADLMMTASKEVEAAIVRLTQLARAAGMHLVIATQRPSVDVITGLIKANTPSRVAFAVSSGVDSRTILDQNGAENLLGRGDMLYAPFGSSKPVRIQGTFVSDKEVEDVVDFIKERCGSVEYDAEVVGTVSRSGGEDGGIDDEIDEYLEDAIRFVVDKQKASISMLQRAFRIGFNRAARLMDALYARGIVGEDEGSKPRKVLMSKEEYESSRDS